MSTKLLNPRGVHPPAGPYSHTALVPAGAQIVFIAGQVGMRPDGSIPDGFAEQAEVTFANVRACLAAQGPSVHAGVKLCVLVVPAQRAPGDVILATRTPDALAGLAARGADVRYANFDEPRSLDAAFAGAERLLLISATDLQRRVAQHAAALAAAKAAGVRHVIYTSGSKPRSEERRVGKESRSR